MRKLLVIWVPIAIGMVAATGFCYGQKVEPQVFIVTEVMPRFPGCEHIEEQGEKEKCADGELRKYLGKKLKYPKRARIDRVEGVVYINFIVLEDGSIDQAKISKGIGAGCDEEALRVIKNMPKWIPGVQRGKNVRVAYNIPLRFVIPPEMKEGKKKKRKKN